MHLKISSRKSDLARLQAYMVGDRIQNHNKAVTIEYNFRESLGDVNLTDPLWKIPEKGVFTEDFYQELVSGKTDMVVHSWKDLPTEIKPDTVIAATLPRADQRDLLIVKKSAFEKIKSSQKLILYSSSPRRAYNLEQFLKESLPFDLNQIEFNSVRGNIQTRVRKLLESQDADGLILAKAAIDRLLTATRPEFEETKLFLKDALTQCHWCVLPLSINPNAAAQGALAIEIKKDRTDLFEFLQNINHVQTYESVNQERKILSSYGGGCHQKIGIAVVTHKNHKFEFLQGLTDSGEILGKRKTQNDFLVVKSEMFFQRQPLNIDLPQDAEALFVSHPTAWNNHFKFSGVVWTAGTTTWKHLAKLGVWVNGTQDGLGEEFEMNLSSLVSCNQNFSQNNQTSKQLKWYKLTHSKSNANHSMQEVKTYELVEKQNQETLQNVDSYYWKSGTLFEYCLEKFPFIKNKTHYCGPGHTFERIKKYVNNVEVKYL